MSAILIVQPSALDRRAGAAQIALNLHQALSDLGHAVELLSPSLEGRRERWWERERELRRTVEAHLRSRPTYDLVDAPAWLLTRYPGRTVARSVQPELEYLRIERSLEQSAGVSLLRRLAHRWHSAAVARSVRSGWERSTRILCLGAGELERMKAGHPELGAKLRSYRIAPSAEERRSLRAALRARRSPVPLAEARFLWIGRWAAHKGLDALCSFAAEFLRGNPRARLTIAGSGRSDLVWRGSDLAANPSVRVVPTFEREQLPPILAEHDAGLFTSSVEGWGLGLQEMLEAGLPVFATQAGGAAELGSWFPSLLRPFPPRTADSLPEPLSGERLASYDAAFSWERLAAEYLEAVQ